jgi:hypothetical protein
VGPTLLLSASLLLGQAQDEPGWTTTTRYTQTSRTWTSTNGWTTTTTSGWTEGWTEDRRSEERPVSRFGDRLGNIFGRKQPERGAWKPVAPEPDAPPPTRAENEREIVTAPPLEFELLPVPTAHEESRPAEASRRMPKRIALSAELTIEAVDAYPEVEAVKPAAFGPKAKRRAQVDEKFRARLARAGDYTWITGQLHVQNGVYELHFATEAQEDGLGGILVLDMSGDLTPLKNGDLVTVHGRVHDGATAPVYRPTVVEIVERR